MTNLRTSSLSVLCCALVFCAVLAGPASIKAQNAAPSVRIVTPIDEGQLLTLKGNTHPLANAANDRGPVSASLPMTDLTLVLSRSPEVQAAFDAFVAGQYDSNSPDFHHWLTPAEIGERFGPAQTDVAAITSWLTSRGFTVTSIPHDHMSIHFSGTAAQVESAFHVEIHNLSVNGVGHIGNMTDPQIPTALAPVILGVKGMHNFLPKPLHKVGSKVQLDQESGKWQRVPAVASADTSTASAGTGVKTDLATGGLRPQFGIFTPAQGNFFANLEEDIAPADFATIYNVQPLYDNSINGTGQTIAIVGTSDLCLGQSGSPCNSANDVASFRSAFGLSAGLAPNEVKGANGIDPGVCATTTSTAPCTLGDLIENSLDVEWSGAVAPGAQIVLVTSGYNSSVAANVTNDPLYQSAQYVINNHGDSSYPMVSGATILSMSYGECELFSGTSSNVAYNNLWQVAAAEGISAFVSSGDSGSAGCDDQQSNNYGNPYSAQFGITVSGQASTPYNTAVGGTDFSWCKPVYNPNGQSINGCPNSLSSPGPYWNTSNNSTTGGSAKGYVPEVPWNDTCTNPIWAAYLESLAPLVFQATGAATPTSPEAACNWVESNWSLINFNYQVDLSPFVDTIGGSGGASNCVANNADTYTGSGYPSCTSAATSTGTTTNPNTGTAQASLTLVNNGWPKPSWQTGVTGIPSDGVRDLPDVSFFSGDGSDNSATLVCASVYSACSASTSGNGATTMLEVGGTSVATPEMAGVMALINQKAGTPQGLATPGLYKLAAQQTYSSCSSESVTTSTNCYFNDVDQGTNAMPCDLGSPEGGDLSPPYAGVVSPNCTAINAQDANNIGTLVSSGTTPGYNATLGYDAATGLGSLNVANVVNNWTSLTGTQTATLGVTPNSNSGPIAIEADASLSFAITVSGSGGTPTGSVTVSGGGFGATQSLAAGAATVVVPANSLAPGSQTLTVTYSGDSNYASTSTPETVNVAADSPTVTVNAPATQNVANSFSVTVAVSGPVGAPVPSGTVTLSSGSYNSTAATLNSSGVATVNIPANTLAASAGGTADTLTATYSGSNTYAGGTGSTTVTIVNTPLLTPTVTVTPSSNSIDSGQVLPVTVKVTGSGATPTGTVTLTSPSLTSAITGTLDLTGTSPPLIIPANSFAAGAATLTFSYTGDASYHAGSGTSGQITVTQSTYVLTPGTPSPSSITPGSSATVSIGGCTGTSCPSTNYTGTVTFASNACSLTSSSVASPNSPPTCSISGTITYVAGVPSGTATATVRTTAGVASLTYPTLPSGKRMLGAGSGFVLAFLVFLGIPARRRAWRSMLGMVMLIAALGTLTACGGGGASGGGGNSISATSAGTYTFTVTGTAAPSVGASVTTTFTVTVN